MNKDGWINCKSEHNQTRAALGVVLARNTLTESAVFRWERDFWGLFLRKQKGFVCPECKPACQSPDDHLLTPMFTHEKNERRQFDLGDFLTKISKLLIQCDSHFQENLLSHRSIANNTNLFRNHRQLRCLENKTLPKNHIFKFPSVSNCSSDSCLYIYAYTANYNC